MLKAFAILKALMIQNGSDRTKQIQLEISDSATTSTKTTLTASQTANRSLALPDATDTLVGKATTDILTNKTIDGDTNTVQDLALTSLKTNISDASKFLVRDASGIVVSNTKAVPTGDVVGTSDSQVLTNKTIDADLNTLSNIENADIKAAAAIAVNKLAALTASRAVVTDGSGFLSPSATTSTEIGYVSGVTSSIQDQLDDKIDITGTFTDERVLRADGTDSVQDSAVALTDAGAMSGLTQLDVDNIRLDGSTVQSVSTNDLNLTSSVQQVVISSNSRTIFNTTNTGSYQFKTSSPSGQVPVRLYENATNGTSSVGLLAPSSMAADQSIVFPDASTTLLGTDSTQVITNKDIDGGTASNTSRITLPKNTKTNLDALTRKEATIVYASDENILYADDGATLTAIAYGVSTTNVYRSVTTYPDTITNGDETLGLSGASGTVTLPTAVGVSGKPFKLLHLGTSLTQIYTIATTGGQTVGGIASGSYVLRTNGERLEIVSDGANWQIVNHDARTLAAAYTPTITGHGSPTSVSFTWSRDLNFINISGTWVAGTVDGNLFSITLPTTVTIDSTQLTISNTTANPGQVVGEAQAQGSVQLEGRILTATGTSTTLVYAGAINSTVALRPSNGNVNFATSAAPCSVYFRLPISGWRP